MPLRVVVSVFAGLVLAAMLEWALSKTHAVITPRNIWVIKTRLGVYKDLLFFGRNGSPRAQFSFLRFVRVRRSGRRLFVSYPEGERCVLTPGSFGPTAVP